MGGSIQKAVSVLALTVLKRNDICSQGANSGIGRQTALEIAKRGGTVHLVCRNPEFGQEARDDIQSQSGNSKIHLHILDLSKPKEISSFLGKWCSEHEKLDVLVNNAGCMVNTREVTE